MRLYVGTSGFSYAEWKGSFYPDDLPAREMLAHYAGRLPAVEINNTFYRMPRHDVLESWSAQVPPDFRLVLKASRRITHMKRLENARDEVDYLYRVAQTLGDKLGAFLFQLPPYFRKDLDRLQRFLDDLPDPARAAFEFRHPSWHEEDVFELLRGRDCALCVADADGTPDPHLVATASWGYLRLRRPDYDVGDLERWAARVLEQPWEAAYVLFKHEEAGAGPELAARFLAIANRS